MITFNKKYRLLYTTKNSLVIIYGGRGSGKSHFVADYACRNTYQVGESTLYTRYTLTSAKTSIIPEYNQKIQILNAESHFKVTDKEISNKLTGSDILFKGIKAGSKIQTANLKGSKDITKWICDEAIELPDYDIFQNVKRTVRKKGADIKIILVLNPAATSHWIYKEFFEKYNIPDYFTGETNGITYIYTNYLDNINNLSDSFLLDAETTKNENLKEYENIFLGKWGDYLSIDLFPKHSLNWYSLNEIDIKKADSIISITDPNAVEGNDFFATIFVAIFDAKAYIFDVIFNKNNTHENLEILSNLILEYKSVENYIEINNGGELLVDTIFLNVNNDNYEIIGTRESVNKHYRININSRNVKKHIYFLKDYEKNSPYELFINNLITYEPKAKNDESPDVVTNLAIYLKQKDII